MDVIATHEHLPTSYIFNVWSTCCHKMWQVRERTTVQPIFLSPFVLLSQYKSKMTHSNDFRLGCVNRTLTKNRRPPRTSPVRRNAPSDSRCVRPVDKGDGSAASRREVRADPRAAPAGHGDDTGSVDCQLPCRHGDDTDGRVVCVPTDQRMVRIRNHPLFFRKKTTLCSLFF